MLTRLFEGLEERLVAFLFWSAVFVPILLGAVTVARRYDIVEVDMMAGTNATEQGDGEWSSLGPALATWTPKTPEPPATEVTADAGPAGGDGEDGTAAVEKSDGGEPKSKAEPTEKSTGGSSSKGDGVTAMHDPGSGTGSGSGTGTRTAARPLSAGGGDVGKPKECLPPDPRISKQSETDYTVDREIIDYYAKHLKEFDDLAYTLAYTDEDGNPGGFKVTRMRCGNPLLQAGLKNGDVITTVNGKRVNNTMQAAATYLKLRGEDHLRVEVVRKGEPVRLEYDVNN